MASRALASAALLLSLNILFFTLVSSGKPEGPKYQPSGTSTTPTSTGTCPRDALKLQACANVLNLAKVVVGEEEKATCCSLIAGLVDLEAAACLCTRVRADLLGLIKLDIPVAVTLLLNECNREVAKNFQCP
ncbi:unnamed protein product [Dovyalis caffra]|uniref:Bifunctional inhibitor/plant lipid transfer protein/seed storage helical domain-containing protein n=1 Tax=Dovyalis caffra TaxID=77055 RepID=A0AAV1QNX1_9ROSI|nr:unnamed protein product [Dovyalis caffra]